MDVEYPVIQGSELASILGVRMLITRRFEENPAAENGVDKPAKIFRLMICRK
jgi:hypothetical protein